MVLEILPENDKAFYFLSVHAESACREYYLRIFSLRSLSFSIDHRKGKKNIKLT